VCVCVCVFVYVTVSCDASVWLLASAKHVNEGWAGKNRIYTVFDRMFGDFPADNVVYTPYKYIGFGQCEVS